MPEGTGRVRKVSAEDAAAIAEIYGRVVAESAASFEFDSPDEPEMLRRIVELTARYPWLVWDDGGVKGYAYAGPFRSRAAYQWSSEVSISVADEAQGQGVGGRLLDALLVDLKERGFVNVGAGTTLPNEASVGLFESRGFERVAMFPKVGHKFGRWHDVGNWQLTIGTYEPDPPPTT
jgi:phosphinothricin acetyltransferase